LKGYLNIFSRDTAFKNTDDIQVYKETENRVTSFLSIAR